MKPNAPYHFPNQNNIPILESSSVWFYLLKTYTLRGNCIYWVILKRKSSPCECTVSVTSMAHFFCLQFYGRFLWALIQAKGIRQIFRFQVFSWPIAVGRRDLPTEELSFSPLLLCDLNNRLVPNQVCHLLLLWGGLLTWSYSSGWPG